jgi:predicted helicase
MTVVFSTYQSIEVVAAMQATTGLRFDLIVCDEAHRTAGVASVAGDDSAFALVHDDAVVPAAKAPLHDRHAATVQAGRGGRRP